MCVILYCRHCKSIIIDNIETNKSLIDRKNYADIFKGGQKN